MIASENSSCFLLFWHWAISILDSWATSSAGFSSPVQRSLEKSAEGFEFGPRDIGFLQNIGANDRATRTKGPEIDRIDVMSFANFISES